MTHEQLLARLAMVEALARHGFVRRSLDNSGLCHECGLPPSDVLHYSGEERTVRPETRHPGSNEDGESLMAIAFRNRVER